MNKDVKKYLEDTSLMKHLPYFNDTPTLNSESIIFTNKIVSGVRVIEVDGADYYLKEAYDKESRIVDIASSDMYNAIGIDTPHLHLLTDKDRRIIKKNKDYKLYTITKDLLNIPGYDCVLAADILNEIIANYKSSNYNMPLEYKWFILKDEELKNKFLSVMTKKCLDDIINLFLLDELRMDIDRHYFNYILYKKYGTNKYQGVIPFDLEQVVPFVLMGDEILSMDRKNNYNFLINYFRYNTQTPIQYVDEDLTYVERISSIMELLQFGDLNPKAINLLRKEIAFDFPDKIKEICQNPYLKQYEWKLYDVYARLWDYNRKTLGKEIGM